ncbi:L,D-transpeptidase family protein [Lactobacillus hamsteri]|uniref:Secreted protein n=2 Tax=Lactobacillus hamsteri TaxID=96565 RepID=A0A0R1YHJ7_9LACO|nr:secreted protein [Lactobacillus hamsteri DSM 5661 = JCM 6256]
MLEKLLIFTNIIIDDKLSKANIHSQKERVKSWVDNMQSRQNLRKRNNRNNLYLVIAGVIIVIAIIFGVVIHNNRVASEAKARKFATTHFNPNVKIYGVKVGKLTVNKATDKINEKANNTVRLDNDKIIFSRDPQVQTITKDQVKNYFDKQHTDLPSKNKYNYKSSELSTAQKKLKAVNKAVVTYNVGGKSFKLKADDLIDKASYKDGKYNFEDVDKLTDKMNEIDKEVSTLHKSYKFKVPAGKTITVKNESYGWGVYVKKAKAAVEKAFMDGTKTVDGKDYIYGLGYSTYAHGYGKSNNGIGKNYIVVSIKKQEVWVVRKGKVVVHLNDVVTGTYTGGKGNRTPTGVWYIQYKESPSTLRGTNDDGSSYASKVQYWMPFTLSGCGFHDASWRNDWSKTAYLRGGSHGCVNIRPSEVHSVWANVAKDDPVIVYN